MLGGGLELGRVLGGVGIIPVRGRERRERKGKREEREKQEIGERA